MALRSKIIFFYLGALVFLLTPEKNNAVAAQLSGTLVISEIAWMGTKEQWQNEWIELYNTGTEEIIVDGWKLVAKDNTPLIKMQGAIPGKSYFLLERSDDNTVPNVRADQIYTGGLNNEGEYLVLYSNKGEVVDEVNCALGWFAGDNESKKTMERISPYTDGNNFKNWQTSQTINGTPKEKNSIPSLKKQKPARGATGPGQDALVFCSTLLIASIISLSFSIVGMKAFLKVREKKDNIN